ncbi:MAG: arylsulfatase [Gammaproteobacteria bacterium]
MRPLNQALVLGAVIAVLTGTTISYAHAQEIEKPNVVFMMMDNLGWGEIGTYGGGILRGAPTPRLDTLAEEGMKLLNFNVENQCTPSRSALMTGRHPIRSGTTRVVWGQLYGMVGWEKTMAELMSDAGYATGMFGKWHLGDTPGRFPTDQGFDEWFGVANTTDESMYRDQFKFDGEASIEAFIQEATRGVTPKTVMPYTVEARRGIDGELNARAIRFMEQQVAAGKPFFAYIPYTQPHVPTLPHKNFDGKTGNGSYADVIAEIDHRAGEILDAIDRLKIRDNTIVVWTSDNGPEAAVGWQGTAGFWRGSYFTALEGSLRTSFLIRWPGKIQSGSVSNEIVHITDILPTLARVAGYKVPDDREIDGIDQLDFFLGKQKKSNREGFPIYLGDELSAYKWRDWKVHFTYLDSMFGTLQPQNFPRVHNLIKDPKELYPDRTGETTWVLPAVSKLITKFSRTLAKEPPIRLGTPDPYRPLN